MTAIKGPITGAIGVATDPSIIPTADVTFVTVLATSGVARPAASGAMTLPALIGAAAIEAVARAKAASSKKRVLRHTIGNFSRSCALTFQSA